MAKLKIIAMRKFSLSDQIDFGRFSGDTNPIHIDPVAARRTLHGVCIVHGMHAILWALEELAIRNYCSVIGLKARFSNPLVLDCDTKLYLDEKLQQIILTQNGINCISMSLSLGVVKPNFREWETLVPHPKSADQNFDSFSIGDRFRFNLHREVSYNKVSFPALAGVYGDLLASEIAGLSQLVGMECPGTHSLFASVSLSLCEENKTSIYKIVKLDERLGLIHIEVFGLSINASLECFFRPKPVVSLTYRQCLQLVERNEFKDVNALIIGGSRGLGECTSKLIAAGGGKSFITYLQGADDAAIVKADINSLGGSCEILPFDIEQRENIKANVKKLCINQLFYYASPKISSEQETEYDAKKAIYKKFYCQNFKRLANNLHRKLGALAIFYPSTVYIDEKKLGFKAYIDAKLDGEAICQELLQSNSSLNIMYPRLPALQTDQNQSILGQPQNVIENASVLLPEIRKMKTLLN